MSKGLIDQMVDRFLCWELPKDFAPDCGISFDSRQDDELNKNKTWPVGTNLLTAEQARQMFQYVTPEEDDKGCQQLRAAESKIAKLRSALAGLVGVDGKEELETMEAMIRLADAPAKDKAVTIDAIHALLETA